MDLRTEIENIVHEILMEGVTKEDAVKELLNLHTVVGQSEQYCECSTPKAFTSDKLYMCCEICDREVED